MNLFLHRCRRLIARPSLAAALLALLCACGPTGGGTGTGDAPATLADFGARPASSCSAPFAAALSCASVSATPADAALLEGTRPVLFVGSAASGPYALTLQGHRADLQSRCLATRFEGEWGLLPNGDARYFGNFTGADRAAAQPALAWVQSLAGTTDGLQLLVLAADGRVLFGPLSLRRVAAAPSDPPLCP